MSHPSPGLTQSAKRWWRWFWPIICSDKKPWIHLPIRGGCLNIARARNNWPQRYVGSDEIIVAILNHPPLTFLSYLDNKCHSISYLIEKDDSIFYPICSNLSPFDSKNKQEFTLPIGILFDRPYMDIQFSTSKVFPLFRKGGIQIFTMEKDIFSAKEEFIPSDRIAEPLYVWNLIALIITIIFCFFSFRII